MWSNTSQQPCTDTRVLPSLAAAVRDQDGLAHGPRHIALAGACPRDFTSTYTSLVLCMSWCTDSEFRVTRMQRAATPSQHYFTCLIALADIPTGPSNPHCLPIFSALSSHCFATAFHCLFTACHCLLPHHAASMLCCPPMISFCRKSPPLRPLPPPPFPPLRSRPPPSSPSSSSLSLPCAPHPTRVVEVRWVASRVYKRSSPTLSNFGLHTAGCAPFLVAEGSIAALRAASEQLVQSDPKFCDRTSTAFPVCHWAFTVFL